MSVINAVSSVPGCSWEIDLTISDIRDLLPKFYGAQIRHVFQEVNRVADKLVSLRRDLSLSTVTLHSELCALVRNDAINWWSNLDHLQIIALIKKKKKKKKKLDLQP